MDMEQMNLLVTVPRMDARDAAVQILLSAARCAFDEGVASLRRLYETGTPARDIEVRAAGVLNMAELHNILLSSTQLPIAPLPASLKLLWGHIDVG